MKCFGLNDCYPLAFGSAAIGAVIAFVVFWVGKPYYKQKKPSGNMVVKVSECIFVSSMTVNLELFLILIFILQNGISEKFKTQKTKPKAHWLDYAEAKHGKTLVEETKCFINLMILYIPLPFYYTVYQLQGSRWIFQATQMNGDLGFYTIKPDQVIAFNPVFGIAVYFSCESILFPLVAKIGIKTNLQRMTFGFFMLVVAQTIAAFMQMKIENDYISIFWLAPQFLASSFSENFMYNSHLKFAYKEAPESMKSVMTSFVYVVMALGNIFVIAISGTKLFESQSYEFFFFAGVALASTILFGFLAFAYKSFIVDKPVSISENKV